MDVILYTLLAQAGDSAAPAAESSESGGGLLPLIIMLGAFLFIMWFFSRNRQQNELKQFNQMINDLKSGDKVVTNIGIIATVANINRNKDNEVLEIQLLLDNKNNVKLMVDPRAISYVVTPDKEKDK